MVGGRGLGVGRECEVMEWIGGRTEKRVEGPV